MIYYNGLLGIWAKVKEASPRAPHEIAAAFWPGALSAKRALQGAGNFEDPYTTVHQRARNLQGPVRCQLIDNMVYENLR